MGIAVRPNQSGGYILNIRVTPKGGNTGFLPIQELDTEIRVKISAPPEDGKANQALIDFWAKQFKIPKSNVHIIQGERSRHKQLLIETSDTPAVFSEKLAQVLDISGDWILFQ